MQETPNLCKPILSSSRTPTLKGVFVLKKPTHFLLPRKGLSNRMNRFGRIQNLASNRFVLIDQCSNMKSLQFPFGGSPH